jgi:hypothetical protein
MDKWSAINGVIWGVAAAAFGFSVLRDWEAWAIIVLGCAMFAVARITKK